MKIEATKRHARTGEVPKIVALSAIEQERRIEEAVAHRAFEIFESRGRLAGRELEDWRRAEAELENAPCFGQMSRDGTLWVSTDVAMFEPGTIEIWVASRKLTVCGVSRDEILQPVANRRSSSPDKEMTFHVIDLNCEVNPAEVTAKIDEALCLEISLRKVGTAAQQKREMETATV